MICFSSLDALGNQQLCGQPRLCDLGAAQSDAYGVDYSWSLAMDNHLKFSFCYELYAFHVYDFLCVEYLRYHVDSNGPTIILAVADINSMEAETGVKVYV